MTKIKLCGLTRPEDITAAALMGMECVVFMGEEDTVRQALNVYRMRLLGATVVPVTTGTATLKDAVSEAMREWTSRISDTHYCLGLLRVFYRV